MYASFSGGLSTCDRPAAAGAARRKSVFASLPARFRGE